MNRRIKIYHPMMWMVMHDFILVTALFLRANFKADEEETLGAARPQTCAKAVTALDPQLAIVRCRDKQTSSACHAGVTESLKASGPRKPGIIQGEKCIFPLDYSLAFPGCNASGLAASPPGQKHYGTKPDFCVPPSFSGNQVDFYNSCRFRY